MTNPLAVLGRSPMSASSGIARAAATLMGIATRTAVLAIVALGISSTPSRAADAVAKLSQLSWLAGHWEGTSKGSQVETHWGGALGDSMLGIFRASQDGKAKFYEILVIEQEATGPVLTLKHFGRKLVSWEGEPAPVSYPLISVTQSEAVFANPSAGGTGEGARRIVYRKTEGGGLLMTLEGYKEGKILTNEFRFTRKAPLATSPAKGSPAKPVAKADETESTGSPR